MANPTEISKILAMLALAFPKFSLEKDTIAVYSRLLADLPSELLEAAAIRCATNFDFFPSVHEIRNTALSIRTQAENLPTAWEAWQQVVDSRRHDFLFSGGKIIDGIFSHPLVERIAYLMGWPSFPGENLSTDRAHFIRAYEEELKKFLEQERDIPEVRKYIESHRPIVLEALAQSMRVK